MRLSLFFLLLFVFGCSSYDRGPSSEKSFHVVFDLDWTLVSTLPEPSEGPDVFFIQGKYYRLHPYAREVIGALADDPRFEVSFFSGGQLSRNIELLSAIKLSDERSLNDIAFRVLGFDDLTDLSHLVDEDARFSEKLKKDLQKISLDLKNTVMLEDDFLFALNEAQQRNFLWLGETFDFYDKWSEVPEGQGPYLPKSQEEWFVSQQKLKVFYHLLMESAEVDPEGISFVERLRRKAENWGFSSNRLTVPMKLAIERPIVLKDYQCYQLIDAFL